MLNGPHNVGSHAHTAILEEIEYDFGKDGNIFAVYPIFYLLQDGYTPISISPLKKPFKGNLDLS